MRLLSLVGQYHYSVRANFNKATVDRDFTGARADVICKKPGRFEKRNHLGVTRKDAQLAVEPWYLNSVNVSFEDLPFRSDNAQLNLVSHNADILTRCWFCSHWRHYARSFKNRGSKCVRQFPSYDGWA